MDYLERLVKLEENIAYRTPPPAGMSAYCHVAGSRPVLISAPHSTCHTRKKSAKMEEEFTAGFAQLLAEITDCHAFFNRWEIAEDPNWDKESAYKKKLASIVDEHQIGMVIDLHGMTNRHNLGVAVGTMNGRSCPKQAGCLRDAFLQNGFGEIRVDALGSLRKQRWDRLIFDHPKFTGGVKSHTVTRFVVDVLQIPAVQVELTSAVRIAYRGPHDGWPFHYFGEKRAILATLGALQQFICSLPHPTP